MTRPPDVLSLFLLAYVVSWWLLCAFVTGIVLVSNG